MWTSRPKTASVVPSSARGAPDASHRDRHLAARLPAKHRDEPCKASIETISKALDSNYRAEHVFALRQALELYDFHRAKVDECDTEIEAALFYLCARIRPWSSSLV
jgi:hypothetical protein